MSLEPPRTSRRATITLGIVLALFVAALGYLVVSSLSPRRALEFAPTALATATPRDSGTVTLDARDERRWVYFDADRGLPLTTADSAGWDLAARRHTIIVAAAGAIADAGRVSFDSLDAPPAPAAFVATSFARDTNNAVLARWYRYGAMSHLLDPDGRVFVLRTGEQRLVKVQLVSYYCPGLEAACITIRFAPIITR